MGSFADNEQTHCGLSPAALVEAALIREEGCLSESGALVVETGARTGRSARDKFIVDSPSVHDIIAWGGSNQPISKEIFDALYERVRSYLDECETYVFEGHAGVDGHSKAFRIECELASQALFSNLLLRAASEDSLGGFEPDYSFIVAPGFECDPSRDGTNSEAAIMIDHDSKRVLIAGTRYSGEIKKTVFSIMNFLLPDEGVLPMHCAANVGADGSTAVFFGLSGTGKTTLSTDPARRLIGDDEHGWADDMVFNFESGCYAKCIGLDRAHEPEIYDAIRYAALVENVAMDPMSRHLDFADSSITENTRAAYPINHIPNSKADGKGNVPSKVIFLTADAFGVLPPISKLDLNQAMYYFLSGYTSKVAGTEVGIDEPVPTFSTCFGEPFLPLDPIRYALMLKEKVERAGADVYLINTGWNGQGERIPLACTRSMVNAALDGSLDVAEYRIDERFGFHVPQGVAGCPPEMLDPRSSWDSVQAYEDSARRLASMFAENFEAKYAHVPDAIRSAGPSVA